MRAIVLLCLLEAAFIQANDYSWGGPGANRVIDPTTESPCLLDQSSCGCCLMQQQIHRMGMFFNMSLNEVQKELTKAKTALSNVRASRSAFSVGLNTGTNFKCFGPFRDDMLIIYKHIFINLGDGYNAATGIFTVPRSGIYSLALTVYSDAGAPGNTLAACASLQVNDVVLAGPKDKNMQDQEDSATVVLAVHLNAGDQVSVKLPIGCFLCGDNSHYNTFTGFLLYATD
ncbi:C1q-related factor C1q and tumor necrosis factor-related protein 14 [Larimichthys crocea]|uniref:C1q-related factor C1q and tumor necrosis factor-related protein 14 n=1 Tax=Larimichthys crocea TaxID=215358 RepID=A0A6G0IVT9_LARCR|nr:C1q-related factor C1q and tumor necrosis factor-related protein 14 [Larimichthys crocea]